MAKKRSAETTAAQVETVEVVETEIVETAAQVETVEVVEYKKCLENCLTYAEKVRLMVLEVLRQESAYEFSKKASYAGEDFNWKSYNEQFRKDYGNCQLPELMKLAKKFFGLADLDAVRQRRVEHKKRRTEMSKAKFGNANLRNDDSDIEDELIDFTDD